MLDFERPHDLVEAGVYADSNAGFDHGLVVLAMGEAFWLEAEGDHFRLLVEPTALERVKEQLACFERENTRWPPPKLPEAPGKREMELFTPLLWCAAVLASFWAQGHWRDWTEFGLLDASAVFQRDEWWRLVTALFLHGDVGHLVSNTISGIFVFAAVLSTMGRGRGWALLATAATVGNLAAAVAHHSGGYRSLGASTAIFAAVGLLTGRALRVVLRVDHRYRWRTLFGPLAAGLTVLALYGAGGQQVDVMAHLTGFAAGLVLGFVAGVKAAAIGRDASPRRPKGRI
jgi:rhomboid protease GluP